MSDATIVKLALARIASQLEGIEKRPRTYGSPETNECEVRMLVGLRQILFGYGSFDEFWPYARFVAHVNGRRSTVLPLFEILDASGRIDELPKLLGDFARSVAEKWPPIRGVIHDERIRAAEAAWAPKIPDAAPKPLEILLEPCPSCGARKAEACWDNPLGSLALEEPEEPNESTESSGNPC